VILDARKGDTGYLVWDVPRACEVPFVLWVNDETAQYCRIVIDGVRMGNVGFVVDLDTGQKHDVVQARVIKIYPERRLVLVNPFELDDETEKTTPRELAPEAV
jgi:hypothetical protein